MSLTVQQNIDHIQTTHIGSLPRPHHLLDAMKVKYSGQPYDETFFQEALRGAGGLYVTHMRDEGEAEEVVQTVFLNIFQGKRAAVGPYHQVACTQADNKAIPGLGPSGRSHDVVRLQPPVWRVLRVGKGLLGVGRQTGKGLAQLCQCGIDRAALVPIEESDRRRDRGWAKRT